MASYTNIYLLVAHIKSFELFINSNYVLFSICKGTILLSVTVSTKQIWNFSAELSSTKQRKFFFFPTHTN